MKSTVSPSPSTASFGLRIPSPPQLDGIEGLGPKRKQLLMKHFKSLTKIKEATVDEIVTVGIPRAVAEAVQAKLHQGKQEEASLLMEVAEDSESYQS